MSISTFAFVFPGQGSQAVGMLDAWGDHPVAQATLREGSEALGEDLQTLIAKGPKEALDLTTNTQPVMLLAGVLAYRMWRDAGGAEPALVAGHSLGEYSALVASGVLTLKQALPLVRYRAQAMQEAVPVGTGGMAAILGLDDASVKAGCAQAAQASGEVVEAVNFNGPGQVVVAGSKAGVEKACELLKTMGAKRALSLPVSAPFHSSLMKPAADRLKAQLQNTPFAAGHIPLVNNVDVAVLQHADEHEQAQAVRDALYRQAFGPVRWTECVQEMARRGITHVVECGPGKVLSAMSKRIDPALTGLALYDLASLTEVKGILA